MTGHRVVCPALVAVLASAVTVTIVETSRAASLPPHGPLRLLIVSDRVNPHSLPPNELTEPGDISNALLDPTSGLNVAAADVLEVATNDIGSGGSSDPTLLLEAPRGSASAYDVLVYFSHRIPDDGFDAANRQRQDDFVAAVTAFLEDGGGVIAFHHGLWLDSGKEGMLDLIGADAGGPLDWNITTGPYGGQRRINTAPGHFITEHGVTYTGTDTYDDTARGVPADSYPFFNRTPDERYGRLDVRPAAAELELLFGTKRSGADSTPHLLGFTHRRSTWSGCVFGYQPGESQPNALDDTAGPDFQVLANAILYLSGNDTSGDNSLRAVRRPGASDVTLSWTGNRHRTTVFRTTVPTAVVDPLNEIGETSTLGWVDSAPTGDELYFQVARP